MRINLDIQDQDLTPEARANLIGLLHRIEIKPEKFTAEDSPAEHPVELVTAVDVSAFLRIARAKRKPLMRNTPQQP